MPDLDPDGRLALVGPAALGDAELLSFLLTRGGAPGPASLDLARRVLAEVGGLGRLGAMPEGRLIQIDGIGPTKARRMLAALALARRLDARGVPRGSLVEDPAEVFEILRGRSRHLTQERFWVLGRDSRGRRLSLEEVARGGRNVVHVDAGDVFRVPLLEGAASIIVAHNHPSGDPTPSAEDVALTERLSSAGELLGIEVADHVVIADERWVSLRELGYLPTEPVGFRTSAAGAPRVRSVPAALAGFLSGRPLHPQARDLPHEQVQGPLEHSDEGGHLALGQPAEGQEIGLEDEVAVLVDVGAGEAPGAVPGVHGLVGPLPAGHHVVELQVSVPLVEQQDAADVEGEGDRPVGDDAPLMAEAVQEHEELFVRELVDDRFTARLEWARRSLGRGPAGPGGRLARTRGQGSDREADAEHGQE